MYFLFEYLNNRMCLFYKVNLVLIIEMFSLRLEESDL